jgi:prevent-host-death family protein
VSSIPTTISASKARSNFYTLLEEVAKKLKRFTITRRGEAKAVILSPEEVASWEETMEILSNEKLVKEIAQAERELAQGKIISEKKLLKNLGITEKNLA